MAPNAQRERPHRSRAAPAPVCEPGAGAPRRACPGHDASAGVAALGAEVDQPVAGADHVQVVLDHQQRMAGVQQLAQRAHQLGDVVEVQAGGGLVEHEQRALARHRLAAGTAVARRLGQEAGQLEALRLAAGQRGHGLAELDVFQPDVDDRLQRADHLAVAGEQLRRLADGQVQHVGHVQADEAAARAGPASDCQGAASGTGLAVDAHLQHLGAGSACRRNPGNAGRRR
jgi:hypothetical protein